MSSVPIIIEIIGLLFVVSYLLHKYGNIRRQNIFVTFATFIAWYFSFMIIFLLPLDISITTYRQCLSDSLDPTVDPTNRTECKEPWSYVPDLVFPIIWRVIYWTSQALTWIILPFMQSFTQSGEFTFSAFYLYMWLQSIQLMGILLIFTFVRITTLSVLIILLENLRQKLKVICITASNTWGLFLLVLLLGYGLIDVPRQLWFKSRYGFRLKQLYFNLAKMHSEKCEAEEELEDLFAEIKEIAEKIKYNHPYRTYIDIIIKKCPETFTKNLRRNLEDFQDFNQDPLTVDRSIPSEKNLVKLHKRLIKALQTNKRIQNQWSTLLYNTFLLEDIVISEENSNHTLYKSFEWKQNMVEQRVCNPTLGWIFYCIIRKFLLKLIALTLITITIMVIWSEMTFFNKQPVLSLFAIFLNAARTHYNYITIEVMCCIIIAFLCFCAYYTIFKLRIFNYYYLASNHMTDENSLLFSAALVCRLTSPLCYNFLGLVHLDSHITKDTKIVETAFTSIMGHMDVISFISDGFNLYFPMLIFILCLATFFNLGGKTLHFFGFQQFIGDPNCTAELIEDGKNHVKREKRVLQRGTSETSSGSLRRKEISQRWRNTGSTTSLSTTAQNDQRNKETRINTNLDEEENFRNTNPFTSQTRRSDYSKIGSSKTSFSDSSSNNNKYREYEKLLNYKINDPYTDNPNGSTSGISSNRNIFDDI